MAYETESIEYFKVRLENGEPLRKREKDAFDEIVKLAKKGKDILSGFFTTTAEQQIYQPADPDQDLFKGAELIMLLQEGMPIAGTIDPITGLLSWTAATGEQTFFYQIKK